MSNICKIIEDSKASADPNDPAQQVYIKLAALVAKANDIAREVAEIFEEYVREAAAREAAEQ